MTDTERAAAIRGKTMRFIWTEGSTKGKTHEHVFSEDGTVRWHEVPAAQAEPAGAAAEKKAPERPKYIAMEVAEKTYLVSYLASSGFTLTVVLNFRNNRMAGVASGGKVWQPVRGTFEVVTRSTST